MFVLGSDFGHLIRFFIYKCPRFKHCGTGRAMSERHF